MKKNLRITVNGKVYDVVAEILDEGDAGAPPSPVRNITQAATAATAASNAPPPSSQSASAPGDVPSPLAGKVVSITAGVGTQVKVGQPIVVLEAMKMNTDVSSPADGTVKAVHVSPGDSVEEGQALLTIE